MQNTKVLAFKMSDSCHLKDLIAHILVLFSFHRFCTSTVTKIVIELALRVQLESRRLKNKRGKMSTNITLLYKSTTTKIFRSSVSKVSKKLSILIILFYDHFEKTMS